MRTTDLLAYERSPEGLRQSDTAINHWLRAATRLPEGRGLMSMAPGDFSVTTMRSHKAAVAAQTLSVRSGVSPSGIFLAALSKLIRRHLARDLSAMLLVCNNRRQRGLMDFVGQTLGNGLMVIPRDELDGAFVPYAQNVYAQAISAYRRARFDTLRWRGVLTELSARGLATDLSYYFNDVRTDHRSWSGLENRVAELSGSGSTTSIATTSRRSMGDATLFASLGSIGQDCVIDLACDDRCVMPGEASALLEALETFLVEAALAL